MDKINIATQQQLVELNKIIVSLRSKIVELEEELRIKEEVPLPKTIIQQIMEMEAIIRKQQNDLEYYKKHVPVQIIINKEKQQKPTRKGGIPK